jgi:hypothetical protein
MIDVPLLWISQKNLFVAVNLGYKNTLVSFLNRRTHIKKNYLGLKKC